MHPLRDPKLIKKTHPPSFWILFTKTIYPFIVFIRIKLRGQKWKKWKISQKSKANKGVFVNTRFFCSFFTWKDNAPQINPSLKCNYQTKYVYWSSCRMIGMFIPVPKCAYYCSSIVYCVNWNQNFHSVTAYS